MFNTEHANAGLPRFPRLPQVSQYYTVTHAVHDLMPVASGCNLKHDNERALEVFEAQTAPIHKVVRVGSVRLNVESVECLHSYSSIQVSGK